MGGGAWSATVHGVTKSRTRLSDFTFTFTFPAMTSACVCLGRTESAPRAVCLAASGRRQVLGPSGPRHGAGRGGFHVFPWTTGFPGEADWQTAALGNQARMPPGPRAGPPVAQGLATGGWGPPRAEGCRGRLNCSPISRLKAALRASVAKGRLRWEVGQAGSPAAGGCGPGSLPPPGREWRPATEARPAACSPAGPGGYG